MLRFTAPSAVQSEFHLLTWFIMVNNSPAELVHRLLKDGLIVAVLSQGYNGNGVFFIIINKQMCAFYVRITPEIF